MNKAPVNGLPAAVAARYGNIVVVSGLCVRNCHWHSPTVKVLTGAVPILSDGMLLPNCDSRPASRDYGARLHPDLPAVVTTAHRCNAGTGSNNYMPHNKVRLNISRVVTAYLADQNGFELAPPRSDEEADLLRRICDTLHVSYSIGMSPTRTVGPVADLRRSRQAVCLEPPMIQVEWTITSSATPIDCSSLVANGAAMVCVRLSLYGYDGVLPV